MVERSEQALRLLLPRASQPELRRARHLTTVLRLLSNDAQPAAARSVPVTLERARGEMERIVTGSAQRAVVDLFRHHVFAATPADSFAWCGATHVTPQGSWSILETLRSEFPILPDVPAPGERALDVALRLRDAAAALGTAPAVLALMDAQLARASSGPARAEASFRALLGSRDLAPGLRQAAVAGVAECLLDRGGVRGARIWLEEALARDGSCDGPRVRCLLAWTRLLETGEPPAENRDDLADTFAPWRERLPVQLEELREERPEWLPWLAGRAPGATAVVETRGVEEAAADRDAFGAAFLALFAQHGDEVRPVELDAAPGLRPRLAAWLRERRGAAGAESELEHLALVRGELQVAHRRNATSLEGCLGLDTRAVAVAPLFSAEGAVLGWARLELDHHLLPARARLAAAAVVWARRLAACANTPRVRAAAEPAAALGDDPCAQVFAALVDELCMKTRERRWWGFCAEGRELRLAAEGGEGLSTLAGSPRSSAMERARVACGPVLHDGGGDALHPDAAGGAVVPLLARGRLQGLLVVESERRRDLRAADVARLRCVAQRHALGLAAARFARWHSVRHELVPHFEGRSRHAWWTPILSFAASRRPVLITGPAGAGKRIAARWLHFASHADDAPCVPWSCRPGSASYERMVADSTPNSGPWRRAAGGTLLLQRVDRLDPDVQLALADRLRAERDRGVRVVATCAPDGDVLQSALRGQLALLSLRVPALSERRYEIPALVARFAAAACDEEALPRPRFDDEAQATLWRQPWSDNLRELEALVHRAVLLAEGGVVDLDLLNQAAVGSPALVPRLPSRHPAPTDLEAALETTRTRGGRWNKTRAAALLGWDPDTLVARLRDAQLVEEPRAEDARDED